MSKLTLEQLMHQDQDERRRALVTVPGLGGELEIVRLPLPQYLAMMDPYQEGTTSDVLRMMVEIVYAHVPIFHEQALQEAYDCRIPTDVVCRVLRDNMGDLALLVAEISLLYGTPREQYDEIKNAFGAMTGSLSSPTS